jgi:hypothetical protein
VKEIIVLVENHSGILAGIASALAGRGINIESIDGESATTNGVIRLAVDRYDEALLALRDGGYAAVSEDALVMRLVDESGALARVADRFKDADLNIRSLRFLHRDAGHALVSLVTDNNELARELISDLLVS